MKRIPRRIFTEEFKKEAVRLVQSEGLTMAERQEVGCCAQIT